MIWWIGYYTRLCKTLVSLFANDWALLFYTASQLFCDGGCKTAGPIMIKNPDTLGASSIKHTQQSNESPPNCPHWPPKIFLLQGNHSNPFKSHSNLANEQIRIKIHKAASGRHMHWPSPKTFFFNKMPSVFLIFTVSSSLQLFECLFPALVPSEPSDA